MHLTGEKLKYQKNVTYLAHSVVKDKIIYAAYMHFTIFLYMLCIIF